MSLTTTKEEKIIAGKMQGILFVFSPSFLARLGVDSFIDACQTHGHCNHLLRTSDEARRNLLEIYPLQY